MAQRPEDFSLPLFTIGKIIKDAVPSGVRIAYGAKVALSKAASVFVLYATTGANGFAQEKNRKTLTGKDVVDALVDLDLHMLIEPLVRALEDYKRDQHIKKLEKEKRKIQEIETDELDEKDENKNENSIEEIREIITIDSDSEDGESGTISSNEDN